jgi:hypothetical protein
MSALDVRFRPLPAWTHGTTANRRPRSTFKNGWNDTLDLLERELKHLKATEILIGVGFKDAHIRIDGWPRAGAPVPPHPGVEISFATPVSDQRLVYATDVCSTWEHNVRSIAIGLSDLRMVDLHIGPQRGQQYAGYRELTAGSGPSADRGAQLVDRYGSVAAAEKATHPDTRTGEHTTDADFADVQAYKAAR